MEDQILPKQLQPKNKWLFDSSLPHPPTQLVFPVSDTPRREKSSFVGIFFVKSSPCKETPLYCFVANNIRMKTNHSLLGMRD